MEPDEATRNPAKDGEIRRGMVPMTIGTMILKNDFDEKEFANHKI
jgi:hypothetical protein